MTRFYIKRRQDLKPSRPMTYVRQEAVTEKPVSASVENKKKINEVMTTQEKIELASQVLGTEKKVRKIKADKGLIERAESATTILTADNKELLND